MAILCLAAGSSLLLDELAPSELPAQAGEALRQGLAAAVFGVWALCRVRAQSLGLPTVIRLAGWGAVLQAALPLTFAAAGMHISGGTELVLFAFIPASIVFLRSQAEAGFGVAESPMRLLLPALAGLGGAALLIPWSVPGRLSGQLWLLSMAAAAVLSGYAVLALRKRLARSPLPAAAAPVCLGAAAANLPGILLNPVGSRWLSLATADRSALLVELIRFLLEALSIVLSLWLLRALGPVAYSARYLLVLLVALVESFLVARARLTWTVAAGACLMLGASLVLLREREGAVPDSGDESHSQ